MPTSPRLSRAVVVVVAVVVTGAVAVAVVVVVVAGVEGTAAVVEGTATAALTAGENGGLWTTPTPVSREGGAVLLHLHWVPPLTITSPPHRPSQAPELAGCPAVEREDIYFGAKLRASLGIFCVLFLATVGSRGGGQRGRGGHDAPPPPPPPPPPPRSPRSGLALGSTRRWHQSPRRPRRARMARTS